MCLLEKSKNRDLENKTYQQKEGVYKQSAFVTTKSIPDDYSEWNSDAINRRQQQMGNCAKSIWKIDF